ncbi:MAG: hypothetical protein K8S62_08170 [Candidatus Sabulitectum sp.]|nr:hypothetical protein [Candidatus Sabulitectum sp.]
MAETERSEPLLWNFNKSFLLLMVLPAIGLIAASFLVSKDALTDDGYPLNIFLLILGAFFLLSNATVFLFLFISNRNKLEMIQNGFPGTARILEIQETNTRVNGMPRLKFILEVNDGYNPARKIEHRMVVPVLKIATLKKGMEVQIKVHPRKPGMILLLFD